MCIDVIPKWHLLGYFCTENPWRKNSAVQLPRLQKCCNNTLKFLFSGNILTMYTGTIAVWWEVSAVYFSLCQNSPAFTLIVQWTDFHFEQSFFPYTNFSVSCFFSLFRKMSCSLRKKCSLIQLPIWVKCCLFCLSCRFLWVQSLEHHLDLVLDFVAVRH